MWLSLLNFGDKWAAAAVHKNVRKNIVNDPAQAIENIKRLGKDVIVQIFDGRCVVSVKQIHAAAVAAHFAFKAGSNISKKFELEFLLRLAADTQINRAIKKMGIKPETREVGYCVLSDDREKVVRASSDVARLIGGEPIDENELRSEDKISEAMKFYGITEAEIGAVQARSRADAVLLLILERIATLDLMR